MGSGANGFPSKAYVSDLHSAAQKLAIVASQMLASDSLSDEALLLAERLALRASSALTAIRLMDQLSPAAPDRLIGA
jgi:hypothetical protein